LIGLATSMKFPSLQISTLTNANCCGVLGVTCKPDGATIDTINWPAQHLNGTVSDHLSLLTGLTQLFIQDNNLSGALPKLPTTLQYMSVENNQFSGSIPTLPNFYEASFSNNHFTGKLPPLPRTVQSFYAANNLITGGIASFPSSLIYFSVESKKMSGTVPALPGGLVELMLTNNGFTGKLPVLPSSLVELNVASNEMSGPLPSTLPDGLMTFNIYDNSFSGPMPQLPTGIRTVNVYGNGLTGILTVQRPVYLVASANKFTNIIINDMSAVQQCEINLNPIWPQDLSADVYKYCVNYGLKQPFVAKTSVHKRSVEVEKRDPAVANAQMLMMTILLTIIAMIASLL